MQLIFLQKELQNEQNMNGYRFDSLPSMAVLNNDIVKLNQNSVKNMSSSVPLPNHMRLYIAR